MAKDFMASKNTQSSTTTSTTSCPPKTYGVPASPATEATVKSAQTEKKPTVNTSSVSTAGAGRGFINPPNVKIDNTYQHKTNNLVANSSGNSAGATSNNFEAINLNAQFQPNILDTFDALTYHFKLFITDPETSSEGTIFQEDKQIIIAETGVTDLTIDKVEVRTIATPSVESGTGTATNVKFEIVEPSGAGLIDKIFYQSVALGIGNWAVMPVYLQLEFRGRDPLTSSPEDGAPGSLSSLKWLWTLKISRIKANVTHVGTRYEFDAIVYNDFAQTNAIFSTPHNIVLNDLSNFQSAMDELQNKLNADQFLKLINNYSIPDTFKIIVDPDIAKYTITPNDKNTNSRRNDNFVTFENKDATFQAGTGVDKIIDTLLSQTKEYQEYMLNAKTAGDDGSPMNEEPSQMKKFWRIITETRPLAFDPRRQDIAKEFTIFIVQYDIGILDQNVLQTSSPPITLEAQRRRLMTYVQKSILKKRYDYIFTGLNDQVINFDITINNAFANSQARFGGIYLNSAMSDTGVVAHDHAQEEAEVSAALARAISFQNNAKPSDATKVQTAVEEARQAIEFSRLDEDTKRRYRVLLEKSKPESKLSYLNDIQKAGGTDNSGELNKVRAEAKKLSTPITERVTQKQYNFISDIKVNSNDAKNAYSEYVANLKGKLRPIARVETLQDRQIGMGVESSSNSGIQKLSTMFAVALHSGLDSSFQRIKLTIKGDPFWIAPQPYKDTSERIFNSLKDPAEAINWIRNAHFRQTDSVNVYGTDNFFLIRFRTPQVFEGSALENNADENTDVETLSGVYKATVIISRFESGKFTQDLEAILDPEINILDISRQLEAESKKALTTSPEDLTTNTQIPSTAIKKDKIMGSITDAKGKIVADASSAINKVKEKGVDFKNNVPQQITNGIVGTPPFFG